MGRIVAIYARVSTEHEAQLSALENQVQYYDNLLSLHPDWKVYDKYIDEGITGTSVKKRKSFMRMMEDAENGCFDLIVTREVSRFARNTVDTLQETRKLKKMGVEVYFTEDNIWTMNDEDGELRLTIMATLAQNESKKTSQRVKAGQQVSFQNAVSYGTGNILGYDKVGKEYVVNPDQAETVKMIFKLYLEGMGLRKIAYELEKAGRLTALGRDKWDPTSISRTLKNPFYSGTIIYRKSFTPDYLEQKRQRNTGEVEQVVVEGSHEPLVSKEDFALVQEKLALHCLNKGKKTYGKPQPKHIWCKKLQCPCGKGFNRKMWTHTPKSGAKYCYQCYGQAATGSVATRLKRGLSIDGVCDTPIVPEWKLVLILRMILDQFFKDRKRVIAVADGLMKRNIHQELDKEHDDNLNMYTGQLNNLKRRHGKLIDMRMNDEIGKEDYLERKEKLEDEIEKVQAKVNELQKAECISEEKIQEKLEILKYAMEQDFNFEKQKIPDAVIDALVDKVTVYKDHFEFKLNLFKESIDCLVEGKAWDASAKIIENLPKAVGFESGCN